MGLLDLMVEIESFVSEKGLNAYKLTVSELISEMAIALGEEE